VNTSNKAFSVSRPAQRGESLDAIFAPVGLVAIICKVVNLFFELLGLEGFFVCVFCGVQCCGVCVCVSCLRYLISWC